eukprot:363637-Chlamydomonas_euryale.AAC.12
MTSSPAPPHGTGAAGRCARLSALVRVWLVPTSAAPSPSGAPSRPVSAPMSARSASSGASHPASVFMSPPPPSSSASSDISTTSTTSPAGATTLLKACKRTASAHTLGAKAGSARSNAWLADSSLPGTPACAGCDASNDVYVFRPCWRVRARVLALSGSGVLRLISVYSVCDGSPNAAGRGLRVLPR